MSKFLNQHCPSNPTLEYVESIKIPKGTLEIISEGGGSTIDVGKWLSRKYNLKHTAIPTTAGTGSEVTKYCVLMEKGKKVTHIDEKFIPDNFILNPELVTTCPKEVTLSAGLDAMSQALESLWSKNRMPESMFYSESSLNLIPKFLVNSLKNPKDLIARMNMLIAANFSGRAINITGTNICHAISYPLTELYNIPHGLACGMSLGYFAKKIANIDLSEFIKGLGLPKYDIDIDKIATIVMESEKIKDCLMPITKEDIIASLTIN